MIITNQTGIGRGYFTRETVKEIYIYMQEKLAKWEAFTDMIYYSYHCVKAK